MMRAVGNILLKINEDLLYGVRGYEISTEHIC